MKPDERLVFFFVAYNKEMPSLYLSHGQCQKSAPGVMSCGFEIMTERGESFTESTQMRSSS
jgi:hypothetical protein